MRAIQSDPAHPAPAAAEHSLSGDPHERPMDCLGQCVGGPHPATRRRLLATGAGANADRPRGKTVMTSKNLLTTVLMALSAAACAADEAEEAKEAAEQSKANAGKISQAIAEAIRRRPGSRKKRRHLPDKRLTPARRLRSGPRKKARRHPRPPAKRSPRPKWRSRARWLPPRKKPRRPRLPRAKRSREPRKPHSGPRKPRRMQRRRASKRPGERSRPLPRRPSSPRARARNCDAGAAPEFEVPDS